MNRRKFLKSAAIAGAVAVVAPKVLADETPQVNTFKVQEDPVFVDGPGLSTHNQKPLEPSDAIFMVTYQNLRVGFESFPLQATVNRDGYILLPRVIDWALRTTSFPLPEIERYTIYAPMPGSEQTGPWYWLRNVSRREAKASRYTIAVQKYDILDLIPVMPLVTPSIVALPTPESDHWKVWSPAADHSSIIIKCP